MMHICNALQHAVVAIVSLIVIEHLLHVPKVKYLEKTILQSHQNQKILHLACPCNINCLDGCKDCDNEICFCNVS